MILWIQDTLKFSKHPLFYREREIGIPPEQSLETAKAIKERHCFVCPNIAKEFNKFDTDPNKYIK